MEVKLKETERIDELNDRGYRIIQDKTGFLFGLDSVLLTSFACIKKGDRVLDLGTGTGVIPILLEAKTEGAHFTGLEIQAEVAEMAMRSVQLNDKTDKIEIVQGDLKEVAQIFKGRYFNVVTSNPPYMTVTEGQVSDNEKRAISRAEVCCTLEDVIVAAKRVLKQKGRFFMVHRPSRLAEIISLMVKYGFSVRNIRMVYPHAEDEANLVLIEGIYGGRTELVMEKPCIVFDKSGKYTEELEKIYYHEMLMEHRKG